MSESAPRIPQDHPAVEELAKRKVAQEVGASPDRAAGVWADVAGERRLGLLAVAHQDLTALLPHLYHLFLEQDEAQEQRDALLERVERGQVAEQKLSQVREEVERLRAARRDGDWTAEHESGEQLLAILASTQQSSTTALSREPGELEAAAKNLLASVREKGGSLRISWDARDRLAAALTQPKSKDPLSDFLRGKADHVQQVSGPSEALQVYKERQRERLNPISDPGLTATAPVRQGALATTPRSRSWGES